MNPVTEAYQRDISAIVTELGTDPVRGLSESEAQSRRAQHGPNELAAEKPSPAWRRFLAQFQNVLVILLLIATTISAALWIYQPDTALPYEAIAIFVVVLLNAAMGYLQEARAEAAVAALMAMTADKAGVVRDGERRQIPAVELVPGDLVLIEEGDTIPADARLVESIALQVAEAALTGESLPVLKETATIADAASLGDRDNMVFSGTVATYGRGRAIVTATGMSTEMGRIAGMLEETNDQPTPLQQELDRTGRMLGILVVVLSVVMIATIIIAEDLHGFGAMSDALILGVALAVAAVPEGLPAVVTVVLSIGVQRMARRHAIVRHLAAVETLGSASVIASDKTGTLTRNEMTVRVVVTASGRVSFGGSGYEPEGIVEPEGGGPIEGPLSAELRRVLAGADRANNASIKERDGRWTVQGDPTEGALLVAARKAGLTTKALDDRFHRVGEVPFSSERKLMSTVHSDAQTDRLIVFTKGAPAVLLTRCTHELVGEARRPLTPDRRTEILRVNDTLADGALRTLGVALHWLPGDPISGDGPAAVDASVERDLVFAGLIGMIDPPRAEAAQAVARARGAGIRPLMITGDHPRTAAVIARELGISADGRAITGAELERLDDAALAKTVTEVSVYARVNPDHKLRIVRALQSGGAIIAMTGDGVNDAPALKAADIGVAMGITGTDVSKEAADIILADDNFASIVSAVEEGRAIFANIRKFLRFLLSSNIGEVLTMFGGVLLGQHLGLPAATDGIVLPLLATQLLWINLITDGAPALALGLDAADTGLMNQPPRPANERVITGRMWRGILYVGVIMAVGSLFILDASMPGGFVEGTGTLRYGQTMAFTTLVFFQLFNTINARSDEHSALVHMFTNRWLSGAIALAVGLQLVVVYLPPLRQAFGTVPLEAGDWLRCIVVASSVLWLTELRKFLSRRFSARIAVQS